ncbi:SAM-dependent methyltransferase [Mycobacterium sp. djl-10]|nr:SAM-dependent methyltransferase [Mycobacterium sp. djl-10]
MSEAMEAEFGTVAEFTAQVARDLGPSFYIPAGCRGSGSPAALDWLMEHLELAPGQSLLDSGAGVGGPAAYAVQQRSVRPTLLEPEHGGCRAARTLFGYPVVQASATDMPFEDQTFDAAWALGVMCTLDDQMAFLTELRRVVRSPGRIGLLVFMAQTPDPAGRPDGNNFPTRDTLTELIDRSGLRVEHWRSTADLPDIPDDWQSKIDTVTEELEARHHDERAWQLAERQSELIGGLLADGTVTGELVVLRWA